MTKQWYEHSNYVDQLSGWWDAVRGNWASLQKLIDQFHPSSKQAQHEWLEITANTAEKMRLTTAKGIKEQNKSLDSPLLRANLALEAEDAEELHQLLEQTWWGIPESVMAHKLPGFGILCDLCSDFPYNEERENLEE